MKSLHLYKSCMAITLALFLFFSSTSAIFAETEVDTEAVGEVVEEEFTAATMIMLTIDSNVALVDGEVVTLDVAPFIAESRTMVPLAFITRQLGADVAWNDETRTVTYTKEDITIVLTMDGTTAMVNGEEVELDSAPVIVESRTMVPVKFVGSLLGYDFAWDRETNTVTITETMVMKEAEEAEEEATEEAVPSYSLSELQETAVLYSRALSKLEKQEERGEITRDQAADQRTFLLGRTPSTMEELMAKQAAYAVLAQDIQLEMTQKEMELEEDKTEFNVLSAWFDLLQAERSLDFSESELEIAVTENHIASIRYQMGMTSEIEVKMAENNLQEKRNNLNRSHLEISSAYETLNSLIGFNTDARYDIYREEPPVLEIPDNTEAHIRNVLNNSPELWLLEKQVELAEWSLRFYTYNQETDPYSARAIDVETAELTLSQARQRLEDSLRNVHNVLQQMELELNDLLLSLENAKENQRITQLRFEIGMATALDVNNTALVVEQLENGIQTYAHNFEKMLINYQKPWTVSTSAGF